ncbi:hypothetical protein LEP1GSC096_0767 [Leptospira interrogans serovar Hebdomadis str. R499]|nr:hypothetical protein LEP1GSC045_1197 [Leptospira interrogans serovar Pomona str. Kennewicki LC82-25]EKN95900.1 hypothetical protein LEP1GSC014_4275 [Leptospira interrogans serovar Pomona str. Pomona]EKO68731.1 hypothetical protein LEP1GSC069_3047 [Leptospira interrogans serovar Canicola str. Fiocruz LV133]EKR38127.1 hypothetical protein LEP1GSC096_0767 [Leptospira interrogans serovar Hebdomadis str. R499]EKR80674.1 hypothetical protein LEP1GSC099_2261 [Leptospira interrogans str. UI 08452]E
MKVVLQFFRNIWISNRLCFKNLCFKIKMKNNFQRIKVFNLIIIL